VSEEAEHRNVPKRMSTEYRPVAAKRLEAEYRTLADRRRNGISHVTNRI
jgi:hypothetical protein